MSADILKLIPVDPRFVPSRAAQSRAVDALAGKFPEGHDCEAEDHGHVAFIDQGENLEAIICPACSKRIPFYDTTEAETIQAWWHDATDDLSVEDVEELNVVMPCCSRSVPLVTLRFDWPAGFARFELSIWDPGIGENLAEAELAEFETILGCKLRQVRAHY